MNFTGKATMIFAKWIRYNKLQSQFGLARDVKEFKQLVCTRLFGDKKPPENFIKGAKMADWDSLYKVCKNAAL